VAQQATEPVRDTEPDLLFNHSARVYYFGSRDWSRSRYLRRHRSVGPIAGTVTTLVNLSIAFAHCARHFRELVIVVMPTVRGAPLAMAGPRAGWIDALRLKEHRPLSTLVVGYPPMLEAIVNLNLGRRQPVKYATERTHSK
jgi:hypothetical protein